MDYPNEFQTPVNPAGTSVAVSRFMSVCVSVAFLLVIFLCGILIWSARSDRLVPFLISTNNDTGEWTVVGRGNAVTELSATRTMQESLIAQFARNWFTISANESENRGAWRRCERAACADNNMYGGTCVISCAAGEDMYSRFEYDVMPNYLVRQGNGETWQFIEDGMVITPTGDVGQGGGTWVLTGIVQSNMDGDIEIKAFVKIARNNGNFPQTMGFYIADFNAYRMNNE